MPSNYCLQYAHEYMPKIHMQNLAMLKEQRLGCSKMLNCKLNKEKFVNKKCENQQKIYLLNIP